MLLKEQLFRSAAVMSVKTTQIDKSCPLIRSNFHGPLVTVGAFHYARYSRNFSRNSNGKVRFSFFRPEYLGSPLEVVHLFRLEYSDRNSLIREFGKGTKSGKSHSYQLARFNRKMFFHFTWVFPLTSEGWFSLATES